MNVALKFFPCLPINKSLIKRTATILGITDMQIRIIIKYLAITCQKQLQLILLDCIVNYSRLLCCFHAKS